MDFSGLTDSPSAGMNAAADAAASYYSSILATNRHFNTVSALLKHADLEMPSDFGSFGTTKEDAPSKCIKLNGSELSIPAKDGILIMAKHNWFQSKSRHFFTH